jgi:hypothetical protein
MVSLNTPVAGFRCRSGTPTFSACTWLVVNNPAEDAALIVDELRHLGVQRGREDECAEHERRKGE